MGASCYKSKNPDSNVHTTTTAEPKAPNPNIYQGSALDVYELSPGTATRSGNVQATRKRDKKVVNLRRIQGDYTNIDYDLADKLLNAGVGETLINEDMEPRGSLVVPLLEIYHNNTELSLIWQLAEGGDFLSVVGATQSYSEADAAQVLSRVVNAIKILHDSKIVCGNLTIADLVFTKKGDAKDLNVSIANYGTHLFEKSAAMPGCFAPEYLRGKPATYATDMWNLGSLMYTLLVGYAPFAFFDRADIAKMPEGADKTKAISNADEHDKLAKDKALSGDVPFADLYWRTISEDAKAMVKMMLVVETGPGKRSSMDEVMSDPFINAPVTSYDDMPEARVKFQEMAQLQHV